ncbi:MAG: lysophospholipid acyltransferase family protein [Rhizomicrobium sp.]
MGWRKYPWLAGKLFALAFIFAGGGALAVVMRLLLPLMPGSQQERTQRIIRTIFRGYLWMLQALGMLTFSVSGTEKLQACAGKIVIANHPSLLDVVALMALIPRAQCIVKHQLWDHWFLGRLMRTAGYISNTLEPEALIEACRQTLADGQTLIIFPEGTRTPAGSKPHFHRGVANIAILAEAPIQTVIINCTPAILYKGEPWWQVPSQRPLLQLKVGECLDKNFYSQFGRRSIATRKLMDYLENYYHAHCEK